MSSSQPGKPQMSKGDTVTDERPTNVRIEYIVEATINTGNFQNIKPGYRVSADVPDGVHPGDVRAKLKALVDPWLQEDVDEIRSDN